MPASSARQRDCIASLHQVFASFGSLLYTKYGSLIGAIAIEGIDPDGLTETELQVITLASRHIYQTLPDNIIITQYYAHYTGTKIQLKDRDHPICHTLSKQREAFLNQQELSNSSIVHYIEILPDKHFDKFNALELCQIALRACYHKDSRKKLQEQLSLGPNLLLCQEMINKQTEQLNQLLSEIVQKWQSITNASLLSSDQIWKHHQFISNLNPDYLDENHIQQPPAAHWDLLLSDGDCQSTSINGMDYIKCQGATNRYARLASLIQFGTNNVMPGMWTQKEHSLINANHNMVIMLRFVPLSGLSKSLLFKAKENQVLRQNISLSSLLNQKQNQSLLEQKLTMKPALKEKLDELNQAEEVDDKWGYAQSMVAVFGTHPETIKESCIAIKKQLDSSGLHHCWENVNLMGAWSSFLPSGHEHGARKIPITTSQLGALSLVYKQHQGQKHPSDLPGEEAQYIFISENHEPFYYSPFVGGRAMVFGVGPIRSGKSFTKNTLATHFSKYGGMFRAIDIDPGSEPVAECFKDDGGVFRIEYDTPKHSHGFNLFASMENENDLHFAAHLKEMILAMIHMNDSKALQELTATEQKDLEQAIHATMLLPQTLRTLSTVSLHTAPSVRQKMSRWVRGTNGQLNRKTFK